MCPTALMPERERRWPAQVSVMLTIATVMGPSAPIVFSFLHQMQLVVQANSWGPVRGFQAAAPLFPKEK